MNYQRNKRRLPGAFPADIFIILLSLCTRAEIKLRARSSPRQCTFMKRQFTQTHARSENHSNAANGGHEREKWKSTTGRGKPTPLRTSSVTSWTRTNGSSRRPSSKYHSCRPQLCFLLSQTTVYFRRSRPFGENKKFFRQPLLVQSSVRSIRWRIVPSRRWHWTAQT